MSEITENGSSEMCEVYVDVLPDPSTNLLVIVIFGILYLLMFLLGVVGNGLVILLTMRNASLQTVQNIFILNLAASDLIVCCVSLPLTPITSIYKNWYVMPFCIIELFAVVMFMGRPAGRLTKNRKSGPRDGLRPTKFQKSARPTEIFRPMNITDL
jgi:hypothetical protein